jgi:hypothetical protein
MFEPTDQHRFGLFPEPAYGYRVTCGHLQSIELWEAIHPRAIHPRKRSLVSLIVFGRNESPPVVVACPIFCASDELV